MLLAAEARKQAAEAKQARKEAAAAALIAARATLCGAKGLRTRPSKELLNTHRKQLWLR